MKKSKHFLILQKTKIHCQQVLPPSDIIHFSRIISYTLILRVLFPHGFPQLPPNLKSTDANQNGDLKLIQKNEAKILVSPQN